MNKLLQIDFIYWARLPYWDSEEACWLLSGLNPHVMRGEEVDFESDVGCWPFANFAGGIRYLPDCRDFHELAQRAFNVGEIDKPGTPAQWLAWAKKRDLSIPPELAA